MKKFFTLTLLTLLCVGGAEAQLLYRISGNGLEKESCIVGTHHMVSADYANNIYGANLALEIVDMVCGELDMSDINSSENTQKLQAAMCLPDGKHISELLTEEQMATLNGYMNEVLGADFTNPFINRTMGNMRPSAIAQQLQLVVYIQIMPDFNPTALIDSYFQEQALKKGKPVMGLESIDEQIAVLYGSASIEKEIADLMRMAEDPQASLDAMVDLVIAYYSQDLEALSECVMASMDAEEWDRLCVKRNRNWMEKMPSIMSEQSTLFVVGAAHLIGEDGVLALLQDAGYSVTAVEQTIEFKIEAPELLFFDPATEM